ncbi:hypothetical protein CONLIGDRAFT_634000 [Coniochaeta ligniaria NRRL 30616]|uniref:Uncharacterized protein n=1 Tax=Coniochaeta ligniaria NRRL 30616 TaxID=1408157 RepID=A0A1J7IJJ5_9PEZI|nr:hypothetical protein CONLIGDRAFT_634000 [Coniochaeta ligniaria NRRL 30616]
MAAAPPRSFFDLPRELRDVIYGHYVTVDGGFVFNPESGKLKAASPPDAHLFALQYTCRRAAREMAGLALAHNTVTFSTLAGGGDTRERAYRFDFMLEILDRFHVAANLNSDAVEGSGLRVPDSVREAVAREYPQFLPAVDAMMDLVADDSDYRVSTVPLAIDAEPSLHREFLRFLLRQCVEASWPGLSHPEISRLGLDGELGDCCVDAWHIPSSDELDRMAKVLRPTVSQLEATYGGKVTDFDGIWERNRFIYRFSAAAVAIRFLRQNPKYRNHIRHIVLNEDREAVAFPESHGKGLVPFCRENPRLRIERRVNLWTNLFLKVTRPNKEGLWLHHLHAATPGYLRGTAEEYSLGLIDGFSLDEGVRHDSMDSDSHSITQSVAAWTREASVLPSSISLVLDGDPAPEQASIIFQQVVVQEATWHNALEESLARGLLSPKPVYSPEWWAWKRRGGDPAALSEGWVCDGWPQMVLDMISGSGHVSCNFHVDAFSQSDVEQIIWANRSWSHEEWADSVDTRPTWYLVFPTLPPLPNLRVLAEEDLIPQAED